MREIIPKWLSQIRIKPVVSKLVLEKLHKTYCLLLHSISRCIFQQNQCIRPFHVICSYFKMQYVLQNFKHTLIKLPYNLLGVWSEHCIINKRSVTSEFF